MVTAFVLMNIEHRSLDEISEALRGYDGISEVHVVAGEYDMVAVARVEDNKELAELLTDHIIHTEGIRRTKTLISLEG